MDPEATTTLAAKTAAGFPEVLDEAEAILSIPTPPSEQSPMLIGRAVVKPGLTSINRTTHHVDEPRACTPASTPLPEQYPTLEQKAKFKLVYVRSITQLIFSPWVFEIISTCTALAILSAVIAVLAIHKGRPNPVWSGGITLNTVVSFGSMLFRVSLMVPVASCISQLSWIWFAQAQRPLYDM